MSTFPTHDQMTTDRLRILMVEDDEMLQKMFSYAFERTHNIYTAGGIEEGWKFYLTLNPHIVFLDVCLPDGNGHDLAHWIKKRNSSTYIVMATASPFIDDKKEAAYNHVDGYITKPFNKKIFGGYIDWYLSANCRAFR